MAKKIFDIFPPKNDFQEQLELKENQTEVPRKKIKKMKSQKALFLILSFFIILSVFAYFSLSRAEIEIYPEIKSFNLQEKVLINTGISQSDFSEKVFSGIIFEEEMELSKNFKTSGMTQKDVPARGAVRIFNNYNSSQTLVKHTRLQSPIDEICFCLEKSVVIPSGQFADCDVFSCSCAPPGGRIVGGEQYNIRASDFSIPGLSGTDRYMAIHGKSYQEMTGGFSGESPQVTEEDINKAEDTLLQEIEIQGVSLLENKVSDEFIISKDLLDFEIVEKNFSAKAGDETDNFDLQVKIKLKALSFKKFEIEKFIDELIQAEFNEELKEDNSNFWLKETIQEESLQIDYVFELVDWEQGKVSLDLNVSTNIYPELNDGFIKKLVSGKSQKEVLTILSNQPQIKKVNINLWPFWVRKLPKNEENIDINLEL